MKYVNCLLYIFILFALCSCKSEEYKEYKRGADFVDSKNYEEAIASFEKVMQSRKFDAIYWHSHYLSGQCFYNLKRYDKAIEKFEYFLQLPDSIDLGLAELYIIPVTSAMIGRSYFNLGNYDKVLKVFESLPNDYYPFDNDNIKPEHYVYRGLANHYLGNASDAKRDFSFALKPVVFGKEEGLSPNHLKAIESYGY